MEAPQRPQNYKTSLSTRQPRRTNCINTATRAYAPAPALLQGVHEARLPQDRSHFLGGLVAQEVCVEAVHGGLPQRWRRALRYTRHGACAIKIYLVNICTPDCLLGAPSSV